MTTIAETTITGGQLVHAARITNRQVHNWCLNGVFGPRHAREVGTGNPRRFTAIEVVVARACRRLLDELAPTMPNRGGVQYSLLVEVADQVRAGAALVRIHLGRHVELTVAIDDLWADLDRPSAPVKASARTQETLA